MENCSAIIVAAGSGKRMNTDVAKQFLYLEGKEIIVHTVEKFEKLSQISKIVLVVGERDLPRCEQLIKENNWVKTVVEKGGKERQNSVYNGILRLDKDTKTVLIHDGVRPFVTEEQILKVMEETRKTGACVLAVPVKDTIKICSKDNVVKETPDRSTLWAMQTPQGFDYKKLKLAYEGVKDGVIVTDDAMIMEMAGHNVTVTMGSYENIKITTPEDMVFGSAILKKGELKL